VDGTLIANPDSTEVITPVKGGSYRMGLLWIAYGMGETPMFNIECYVDSALFYTERRSAIASKEGISYTTYSQDLWSGEVGQHYVEWILDVDDEVEETYENNNDAVMNFEVATFDSMPYIQILRPTEGDTADEGFWIKWEAYDRESNARIYLYYDVDSIGYNGIAIPTGDPIYEETSPDSFWWNTSNFPDGSCYYVLGMIYDFNNPYVYDYSDYPLYIHHTSGIDEDNWITPLDFALKPNFPNPFNASTTITYSTPEKSRVELSVYDIAGRLVAKLAQGEVSAGSYTVNWQAEATSGVYFCKISLLGLDSGKTFQSLQKMLLIR
jgi:hypothetical protein